MILSSILIAREPSQVYCYLVDKLVFEIEENGISLKILPTRKVTSVGSVDTIRNRSPTILI